MYFEGMGNKLIRFVFYTQQQAQAIHLKLSPLSAKLFQRYVAFSFTVAQKHHNPTHFKPFEIKVNDSV